MMLYSVCKICLLSIFLYFNQSKNVQTFFMHINSFEETEIFENFIHFKSILKQIDFNLKTKTYLLQRQ